MDVTQGLEQELGAELLYMGSDVAGSSGGIGAEIDVQDYKLGDLVFVFMVNETGDTNPTSLTVTCNHGDTGSTGSELFSVDLDQVSAGAQSLQTHSVTGGYDRYIKLESVTENEGTAGTADLTVAVLAGKRES